MIMPPIKFGLVGTGYAAKLRAETLQSDPRSQLVAVAGHDPERTAAFSQTYDAEPVSTWEGLLERSDIDVVVISTINRDHGAIAQAALEAGKHVVVEYPLSLDVAEAEAIIQLAKERQLLLHVEHVELLSGIHLAAKQALAAIGQPFYVCSTSLNAQRPAPQKWTYHPELFGFPLVGALSRIHRVMDLFGAVSAVSCQARFWGNENLTSPYTSCLCVTHLRFNSGLLAEVSYGKGEAIWRSARTLEVHGEQGAIIIDGQEGTLIQREQTRALEVGSRRGIFAKDTHKVLDHLTTNAPLYVTPETSLEVLKVADAARRSAETGQTVLGC
ncbi:MAG: Gfo/Idh/MocA family oxidoreductase [Elainellaceae cyanobacterium]